MKSGWRMSGRKRKMNRRWRRSGSGSSGGRRRRRRRRRKRRRRKRTVETNERWSLGIVANGILLK